MTAGAEWRRLRERSGVSLRGFAKLTDLSPTYVSQVETGERPHGYSRSATMRAILALKLCREEAAEMLGFWRAFHASEVAAIDQFIAEVHP